ncbi:hypothetical protein C0989_003236 [Termitomyces sp. Mn162]|nr:hypothetical protein C0989_003236 [Termitomyces sp. Mn162]
MLALRRLARRPGTRAFTVLALESSADDSCAAVVSSAPRILSNVVLKQHSMSTAASTPNMPSWATSTIWSVAENPLGHRLTLSQPLAVRRALDEAGLDVRNDIDGIAFTRGPGMYAVVHPRPSHRLQAWAAASASQPTPQSPSPPPSTCPSLQQAHALTPLLTSRPNPPKFPFLSLLVSGGHTLLLLASSPSSFCTLATTLDESIGRSYDKVSRHLGIPWTEFGPGAALEQFCAQPNDDLPDLPPYPHPLKGQLALSYSSLHAYVERYLDAKGGLDNIDLPTRLALARGFQTAAVAQLEEKLLLAFAWCQRKDIHVHDVVVSGGVANNAVMIAWASMHRFLAGDYDPYTIEILSKWDIETLGAI